ncbi:GAK system ATP-grasp enzyme [Magnetovibrio blakemorei]|uniref:Glutathione synthase n=1 Tax=Magnetovibrio blakemorei TaxID=28181 RepID=C4RAB9_9PROT|nr:GAK system ATP-grasp enzyme [Magnetovibrio blakemorei]OEJ65749.1 glutathione synthase [Magnetovibrio blakemorei]CAV30764.1 Glutathione synthase/Ribosomal protein S6 modification enzyme [Magnetovibrio blakemorei]
MSPPKIAVIGIPGKWSTEVLADALHTKTGFRLVLDMADVSLDLSSQTLWAGEINLCQLDGIAIKKISQDYSPAMLDRIELLRVAEQQGVRVFSPPQTIVRMIDRLACTVTLRGGGVPMPDTLVSEDENVAFDAVQSFGEAVFKPLYSTKARGMCVISATHGPTAVRRQIKVFKADNPLMYIQRKLHLAGRDYGLVFLGGAYLGAYARVAQSNIWNTTVHSGGKYTLHEPPQSTINMAAQAQKLFGLDFTTVDVADTEDGPIVFEVSAFGGFKGAQDGIGIDAATLYADYMIAKVTL